MFVSARAFVCVRAYVCVFLCESAFVSLCVHTRECVSHCVYTFNRSCIMSPFLSQESAKIERQMSEAQHKAYLNEVNNNNNNNGTSSASNSANNVYLLFIDFLPSLLITFVNAAFPPFVDLLVRFEEREPDSEVCVGLWVRACVCAAARV